MFNVNYNGTEKIATFKVTPFASASIVDFEQVNIC